MQGKFWAHLWVENDSQVLGQALLPSTGRVLVAPFSKLHFAYFNC